MCVCIYIERNTGIKSPPAERQQDASVAARGSPAPGATEARAGESNGRRRLSRAHTRAWMQAGPDPAGKMLLERLCRRKMLYWGGRERCFLGAWDFWGEEDAEMMLGWDAQHPWGLHPHQWRGPWVRCPPPQPCKQGNRGMEQVCFSPHRHLSTHIPACGVMLPARIRLYRSPSAWLIKCN